MNIPTSYLRARGMTYERALRHIMTRYGGTRRELSAFLDNALTERAISLPHELSASPIPDRDSPAVKFIRSAFLRKASVLTDELFKEARLLGISKSDLHAVRPQLGIKIVKRQDRRYWELHNGS